MATTLFYITAAITVLSTVMVITRLNAVHALLYMVISLLSVAFIFYLLGAPFAAALEVIVYAGAIMVLFVFVIMMLNLGNQAVEQERQLLNWQMWGGPAFFAAALLLEVLLVLGEGGHTTASNVVEAKEVGIALFGPYILAVELASILLLAGLIGAYHLGRRHKEDE